MGIIFAILAAILLGFSNFLLKKSFKNIDPSISFFILAIVALCTWAPIGLLLGVDFNQWLLGTFVGLVSAIFGQAIYIYVLEKGQLSITATILSTYSIYTVLLSMIFNHERPALLVLALVFTTILGTVIVSLPEKINKNELNKINFIAWAVFAAFCVGASDTYAKYFINRSTVGSFYSLFHSHRLLSALFICILQNSLSTKSKKY